MVYAQQTQITSCNYGTDSYLMLKTPSSCSMLYVMTHPNQHMKSSIQSTVLITNHRHHLDAKNFTQTSTILHVMGPKRVRCKVHLTSKRSLLYIMDTNNYQICKGVVFLPKLSTIPKNQQWDYTMQVAEEHLVEFITLNKGKVREPSKLLQVL